MAQYALTQAGFDEELKGQVWNVLVANLPVGHQINSGQLQQLLRDTGLVIGQLKFQAIRDELVEDGILEVL